MSFIAAGIGAAISIAGMIISNKKAKNRREDAEAQQRAYASQLQAEKDARPEITDPYANVKDLSAMIKNPFANLQVATQAAEFQAEEADLSLSSSLDTLRATGASAGGATALAQAALRSKKGISANIEQQEAQNARMRAQGQAGINQQLVSEQQRLQQAGVSGAQFMFGAQEQRSMIEMDRLSALMGNQQQMAHSYGMQQSQIIGQAAGQIGGSLIGAGMAMGEGNLAQGKSFGGNARMVGNVTSSCFTKGTLIEMFNGIFKAINTIKKGDAVRTRNNKRGIVKTTLIHDVDKVITIWKSGSAGVNDFHPVIINNKWRYSRELPWDKHSIHVNKMYNLEIEGDGGNNEYDDKQTYIVDGKLIASGKL
jgi:hypothetical protein